MAEFSVDVPLPYVPDNLTIPQFMFDTTTVVSRPQRPRATPLFIEDSTGRAVFEDETKQRTYDLASALRLKWDIGNNDVVCLLSPNHVDYAVVMWATHLLGGIITPGNPSYTVDELIHQITITKSVLLVVHPVCLDTAIAAAKKCGLGESRIIVIGEASLGRGLPVLDSLVSLGAASPGSFEERRFKNGEARKALAFLSLSSGTTGRPKAVAISHFGVIVSIIQKAIHWRINDPSWPDKRMNPGDVAIGVLPFFHIYGLVVNLHYQLFCGMTIVVVPKFNFLQFLESVVKYRVTNLYLVPPQIVLLCKYEAIKNYDLSHVRFCLSGAAPLSGDLCARLQRILPNAAIGQGYGMTEAISVALIPPELKTVVPGSSGRILPGIRAKVIKADGTMAKEGEEGELHITGPSMALGYVDNEVATKETFVDHWVRTGDEVIIKNNDIFVVDRLKEIMKVRGFQVAPAELEGCLLSHPDVADAGVIGIPDDYSGELPRAYVVLRPDVAVRVKGDARATEELKKTLSKCVSDVKAHYKWLAGGIEFIDSIPKNPSGKILRQVLRGRARSQSGPTRAKL